MSEEGNLTLQDDAEIRALGLEETYKYLGVQQSYEIRQQQSKEVSEKEFTRRISKILRTQLNAKNKITAINAWAVPVFAYTSGILNWSATDIRRLDRWVRASFTRHGMLHPNSAVERLYLPRAEGGRGLTSLEAANEKEVRSLKHYFLSSNLPLHRRMIVWDRNYTALNLSGPEEPLPDSCNLESLRTKWRGKELHGRFHASMHQPEVDKIKSNAYLTAGYLFPETEGALFAVQDQVIPTRNYAKFIMKQQVDNTKCRVCNEAEETVQHLSGGCSVLAPTRYLGRHNNMGRVVHQMLALKWEISENFVPHHIYTPQAVVENSRAKLYWDFPFTTDRPVEHNRPDMVLWSKQEQLAIIIDFAVPLDHNMAQTYETKIKNYADLSRELKIQWQLKKTEILPLIVSSNGLVHVNTAKHLAELQLPDDTITWMQKAVVLGTVAIIRQVVFPQ
ncbi:uncharacterized protein LOC123315909 [Coccinella septempunctata]|uniref:uncharacterized protein LOC123315909 n=1 Tax=Coccinella septempunctata TaxID=41139 RepID=UPI001D066E45|nr:uncharacterized protein LOC123315909 [Coccinella septempunctata]